MATSSVYRSDSLPMEGEYRHQIWMGDAVFACTGPMGSMVTLQTPSSTVGAMKLEPYMDKDFIAETFESLGIRLRDVKRITRHGVLTKYAFLELEDPNHMEWILTLNDYPIPSCPMKKFRLNCAGNTGMRKEYNVYVSNFSTAVTNDQLYQFFKKRYSSVTEARVCQTPLRETYGFVRFSCRNDRDCCLHEMNGEIGLSGLQPISVKPALQNTTMTRTTPLAVMPTQTSQSDAKILAETKTDQSDDDSDEEVDYNPPVDYEAMNRQMFSQENALYVQLEHSRWHPIVSLNTKLTSRRINLALAITHK